MDDAKKPEDTAVTPAPEAAPVADPAPAPVVADSVTDKLESLKVPGDFIAKIKGLGVEVADDLATLKEADLTGIGMPVVKARKLIAAVAPAPVVAVVPAVPAAPRNVTVSMVRLAEVPSSSNWLSSLCAIQPQRIPPITVVTGVKAAMADVYGYFQLPKKMMKMLREAADSVGQSVPELFFDLQNLTQARRYGSLVAWMQGKGSACTVEERNRFLKRVHENLWDAIDAFYGELDGWRKGRRESQDVGESMAAAFSGEVQIYDATLVRNAALAFGDTINRVFSGTGVYAATALALDNDKLQKVLEEMDFRQFGVQSREQLLANLGCAVPAEIVAAETTINKFIWNAMDVKNQAAGGVDEQRFLIELASIGTSRPWMQIKSLAGKRQKDPAVRLSRIGGRNLAADEDDEDPDES